MPAGARGNRARPRAPQAATLLATVVGQDIEESEDGIFRIVGAWPLTGSSRRSTPSPPRAQDPGQGLRRLQGPRGRRPRLRDHHRHLVTPGNVGDAAVAGELIADLLGRRRKHPAAPRAERVRRR